MQAGAVTAYKAGLIAHLGSDEAVRLKDQHLDLVDGLKRCQEQGTALPWCGATDISSAVLLASSI